MNTESDRAMGEIYEHLDDCIKALSKILIDKCDGSELISTKRIHNLTLTYSKLLAIRCDL